LDESARCAEGNEAEHKRESDEPLAGDGLPWPTNTPSAHSLLKLCRVPFPRPRPRRVSDLGVARCAGHPSAVHKLPRPPHRKWYKARIVSVLGWAPWISPLY